MHSLSQSGTSTFQSENSIGQLNKSATFQSLFPLKPINSHRSSVTSKKKSQISYRSAQEESYEQERRKTTSSFFKDSVIEQNPAEYNYNPRLAQTHSSFQKSASTSSSSFHNHPFHKKRQSSYIPLPQMLLTPVTRAISRTHVKQINPIIPPISYDKFILSHNNNVNSQNLTQIQKSKRESDQILLKKPSSMKKKKNELIAQIEQYQDKKMFVQNNFPTIPRNREDREPSPFIFYIGGYQQSRFLCNSIVSSPRYQTSQFQQKFIKINEENMEPINQNKVKQYQANPKPQFQKQTGGKMTFHQQIMKDSLESFNNPVTNQRKQMIKQVIENRNSLGNLIKLIEESPLDHVKPVKNAECIQVKSLYHGQEKQEEKEENENTSFDLDQQLEILEKKKRTFILNQDILADLMIVGNGNKQKKKLSFKALRENLLKVLKYIQSLKLTPKELLTNPEAFSRKPFQKNESYKLICAAKNDNILICTEVLNRNKFLVYDFDYIYMTALHWSAKRGHAKLSALLIQKGADVNALDLLGRSPLFYAAQQGHLEVVKLLLFNKAYPWSTRYVSYDKFEKEFPLVSSALLIARKIHVLLNMTPYSQRNMVWQKQGIAFAQILA